MIPKEIIEKAYVGGLDKGEYTNDSELLLKPIFWQSLGKALGWQEANIYGFKPTPEGRKVWKEHWHSFITKLAEGGTPEEFFRELND